MNEEKNLIVMLTYSDQTILNAKDVFEKCKNSKASMWGFKEKPLPLAQMKELFQIMKDCDKTTVLEVVAYKEEECLAGAQMAHECNCDILMGTLFYDSVNEYCLKNHIKYMPYVGDVRQCPSVLTGNLEQMVKQTKEYLKKGAYGVDLLGYRYVGNAENLIQGFLEQIDAPVCVAGSINNQQKLQFIKRVSPWGFTIGSAFFDHAFGDDVAEQINFVVDSMEED